jgi:hypothetical protein
LQKKKVVSTEYNTYVVEMSMKRGGQFYTIIIYEESKYYSTSWFGVPVKSKRGPIRPPASFDKDEYPDPFKVIEEIILDWECSLRYGDQIDAWDGYVGDPDKKHLKKLTKTEQRKQEKERLQKEEDRRWYDSQPATTFEVMGKRVVYDDEYDAG